MVVGSNPVAVTYFSLTFNSMRSLPSNVGRVGEVGTWVRESNYGVGGVVS